MTGTYDLMYHNYNLSTENSLYGQIPLCSFDLIQLGWIASDEILEIRPNTTLQISGIKLAAMRQQLTTQQKANGFYRIAKIYLKEDYYGDKDEYMLVEYHKGTDYDRHFYNYDEGLGEGILVWHVVDNRSNDYNPGMDMLTAVPYNGFYGNPLPDDSYPETWEIYTYPGNFTGIYKNNEYDWLNDIYLGWPPYGTLTIAPNGGRHIYEVIEAHDPDYNWVRRNSKNDDFFTDVPIKNRVNNKITPVTRPSSRDWWSGHTNIGIVNIKHVSEHMEFDFYDNYWAGNISQNETWSDTIIVRGDITINLGVILTINPGAVIIFDNNKKITVNGSLNAQGTSLQGITFKSSSATPSPGSWYGIRVNGSANLSYCTVQHATYGVYYYTNASGTVNQSNLQYNTYGVYAYQSSPNIQNCQIHHNTSAGIYFSSANNHGTAQILNNSIYNNFYGIYLQSSSPDIRNNQINNNYHGVFCISTSSPYLGEIGYYGYNYIHDNQYGLRANSSCNPHLGENGCQVNGGWNQIVNSASYHVWANYNSNVQAEDNWWGSDPPLASKFFCGTGSAIDTVPYLHDPPTMGMMANVSPDEEAFDQAFGSDAATVEISAQDTYSNKWPLSQKLNYARSIIYLGDIPFAEKICKDVIETCPDSALAFFALDILWEASRYEKAEAGYDLKSYQSYLEELIQKKEKKELYGYSKIILADFDTKNNLMYFDQVYNDYHNSFLAEVALYHKCMYYCNAVENMDEAEKVYVQMQAEFPSSEFTKTAGDFVSSSSGELYKAGNEAQLTATSDIPVVYNLYNNYPNPFNPSTTIRYALPKTSSVKIAVYNLLGKRVRMFNFREQAAGNHMLVWKGDNENGAAVSGGVYILRFHVESLKGDGEAYNKSIKMLLLR